MEGGQKHRLSPASVFGSNFMSGQKLATIKYPLRSGSLIVQYFCGFTSAFISVSKNAFPMKHIFNDYDLALICIDCLEEKK